MKTILFLLVSLIASSLKAEQISCHFKESINSKGYEHSFTIPIENQVATFQLKNQLMNHFFINYKQNVFTLSYTDPETKRINSFESAMNLYETIQIEQLFERPLSNSFSLTCYLEDLPYRYQNEIVDFSHECILSEVAGKNELSTPFSITRVESGHDTITIPPAKLNSVNGWVLPYGDILGLHLRDQINYKGRWIGIFGPINNNLKIEWYPNKNSAIKAKLACKSN